mgnify:FL=1
MEIFKNIIPDIITKVWLTGVGSTTGGPSKLTFLLAYCPM